MDLRRGLTLNLESAYHHIHFCLPFFLKSALRHECPRIPSRASKGQPLIPCSHARRWHQLESCILKTSEQDFFKSHRAMNQTA